MILGFVLKAQVWAAQCAHLRAPRKEHEPGKVSPDPEELESLPVKVGTLEHWKFSSCSLAQLNKSCSGSTSTAQLSKINFMNEKHKGLNILLLPYSIPTNPTPAISGCHRTPALPKVRKELKSKGSHSWGKFQTWLVSVLCLWCSFPPVTTLWPAAFVSAWEKVLVFILNIVQILGNESYKPPNIPLTGRWWNHRATSHFLRLSGGLHFSLHSNF